MTEQSGSYNSGHAPDDPHGVEHIADILDRLTQQQRWGPAPPHLPPVYPARTGNGQRDG